MIRVAALTSGRNEPSSRFRVRQHVEPLRAAGFDVREYTPVIPKYGRLPGWPRRWDHWPVAPFYAAWMGMKLCTRIPGIRGSRRADLTWLERPLLPGFQTLEPLLGSPLVFDVDDAIWLSGQRAARGLAAMARRSSVVVAGNAFIADWFSQWAGRVRLVPTGVDITQYRPRTDDGPPGRFVVGWIGSSSNLPYIEALEPALAAVLAEVPGAELYVVCDRAPRFNSLAPVRFERWSAAREAAAIQSMSVGLMPLPDTDWARGKCSFKMLQYMACGLPVVVSPVGMNLEVLARGQVGYAATAMGEWTEALLALAVDEEARHRMGHEAREVVTRTYGRDVVARQLAQVFREGLA